MRKVFLSLIVIITFIAYSFYVREEEEEEAKEVVVVSPASVTAKTPIAGQKEIAKFKDGVYVGEVTDAFYGFIQVQATISNGRISDVKFLQFPNDRSTSIEINQISNPILAQEVIQTQSAQVDIVSGATESSQAFIKSMQSALDKAKI